MLAVLILLIFLKIKKKETVRYSVVMYKKGYSAKSFIYKEGR